MNDIKIQKISTKVKEAGAISVNNFLNPAQFELAKNILKNVYDGSVSKGDRRGYFPVSLKNIIIKLMKFQFNQIKKSFALQKIAQDLQLNKIAEKIFESKVELCMIDSYYSEKSNKNILDWHNDIGYKYQEKTENKDRNLEAASIKFFIYMTDVERENGSLAYIPYSHHIVRAITFLMLEKKIEFNTYWNLKDLRALVLKNSVKDLIVDRVGTKNFNAFLENSKFIEQNSKNTFKFDFEMKKSGAVIFDELGVHRGSMPSKSARLVLRYLYRRKN